jgi:glycine cleavage system H lipoate-binding protein
MGRVEKITLPQRGQWVRQGQKIWSVERNGVKTEMVSPIEGVVTEINEAAAQNPNAARHDPYGEGWMLTVESPDAKLNFRNLLNGDLARWWMEEAATRLRGHLTIPAGAVAQDGGLVVSDLGSELTNDAWAQATREFFLG